METDIDLRIPLHKLHILSMVVQLGGITRAAESLYVSQPVVSAHIRSLEQRLGVKLFFRDGRDVQLTEAGEVVYQWAQDLLTRTRELGRHLAGMSDGARGAVELGSSKTIGSYMLPSVLAEFRRTHPNVEITLAIEDAERALELTRTGALDFAVLATAPGEDYQGLDMEVIGSDQLVLVAAPGFVEKPRVTLEDIAELPFIEAHALRRNYIDRQLRELGVRERKSVVKFGHPEAMKRAAVNGLGVAMLFRSAISSLEIESGMLVEIPVEGLELEFPVAILSRPNKTFSAVHESLLDEIRKAF